MKWTVLTGLLVSLFATTIMMLLAHGSALGLAQWRAVLGWMIFFESLQLPAIAAARRGHVDPCTRRVLRFLARRRGAA